MKPVTEVPPRQRRYPVKAVMKARLLYQARWTVAEIQQALEQDFGVKPHRHTVRMWAEPGYGDRRTAMLARAREHRIRSRRPGPRVAKLPAVLTDEEFLALRMEDKLSLTAMSSVIARFYGVTLSVHQIRVRLDKLGAPRNENKARLAVGNGGRFGRRAAA